MEIWHVSHTHTVYFSALKKGILAFVAKQMHIQNPMFLTEASQSHVRVQSNRAEAVQPGSNREVTDAWGGRCAGVGDYMDSRAETCSCEMSKFQRPDT